MKIETYGERLRNLLTPYKNLEVLVKEWKNGRFDKTPHTFETMLYKAINDCDMEELKQLANKLDQFNYEYGN